MPYRINKSDIEHIAEILPDAYVIDNGGATVKLVLQDTVDPKCDNVVTAVNEENIEEYQKTRRQQFLAEVREVQSFKTNIQKRVLYAILNDACNSIHS